MPDSFTHALHAIYDAALSDQHWQGALSAIAREADALGAILLVEDGVGLPFRVEQSSFPIEGVRAYFEAHGH